MDETEDACSAALSLSAGSFLHPNGDGGGGKADLPSPILFAKTLPLFSITSDTKHLGWYTKFVCSMVMSVHARCGTMEDDGIIPMLQPPG